MTSFYRWLWNGFGLGEHSLAARATGMAFAVLLGGFYLVFLIIRSILRAVRSSRQGEQQG